MFITRANVDQYPGLPPDIIRDIKQNGWTYDTDGDDGYGGWVTDGGKVSDNGAEEKLLAVLSEIPINKSNHNLIGQKYLLLLIVIKMNIRLPM